MASQMLETVLECDYPRVILVYACPYNLNLLIYSEQN
jgi:hypothetical protein